ncbi:unnamed protein product [Symbiodinium natans]|uniref:Uncharacterized protein n=1 Tax=Symbiodinium natans TaxID=878477 RepID=A0A812QU08_9DINO|nr:unnamed protein product [Symbiodinium natans]
MAQSAWEQSSLEPSSPGDMFPVMSIFTADSADASNKGGVDHVTSVASLRSLSDKLPTFLRGVPIRYLLTGAGQYLTSSEVSEADGDVRRLARHCDGYSGFVSHDWKTSRWLKFFSLLVLYNSKAAAVSTFVVSLLGGILIACGALPDSDFACCIGFLNFVLVFLFWQHLRDLFLQPQLVFLDKLCIPQDDEQVKEECILGLAGYLKASEKLVILWSERYFQRLWCMYEVAAFLRTNPKPNAVQIVPVTLPLLLLIHYAWWCLHSMALHVMWHSVLGTEGSRAMFAGVVLTAAFVISFPLQSRAGIHLHQNLSMLKEQLGQFNIHRTECSCCSLGHKHPHTGAALPCDRKLVYRTLLHWHGKHGFSTDQCLDRFSQTVRSQLGDSILRAWGSCAVPLDFFAYTVLSVRSPFLFETIPDLTKELSQNNMDGLQALICGIRHLLGWASAVPVMLFYLWMCMQLWGRGAHPRWPAVAEAFWMSVTTIALAVLSGVVGLPLLWQDPYSLFAAIPFVLLTGISLWLIVKMEQIPTRALSQEVAPAKTYDASDVDVAIEEDVVSV